jgi:hypothetical protein
MASSSPAPGVPGLVIEAVEWLPSGGDAGLVRVRGRWAAVTPRAAGLPELVLRREGETRRFASLPDARFAAEPALWRATYVVGAALMEPAPDALWVAWEDGARAALQPPARGFFEPPARPPAPAPAAGGEVIDRAVLAERRARRAEAAERAQAERAAEAIAALEVLELRSAELERRLEALSEPPARPAALAPAPAPEAEPELEPEPEAAARAALAAAVATVKQLRTELDEQRDRVRRSELLRAADGVALATLRADHGRLVELERALADARAARDQAAEQVALAQQRAARDAATVRGAADAVRRDLAAAREQLAAERAATAAASEQAAAREAELAAIGEDLAAVRAELETVRSAAAARAEELQARLAELEASLAAERAAHAVAATELETARSALAAAEAARRAESVARATLEEELDRERLLRIALADALAAARSEAADRIAALEAELAAAPAEPAAPATPEAEPPLLARIAELERTADDDLARRAAEQATAAAAAEPPQPAGKRLAADLDAAAATLRARAAPAPAAPGAQAVARPQRRHPWLRAALAGLARDDPARAVRLLLGLVPAQRALVGYPLEYDLLIRDTGLYAVSITASGASARPIERPRPRSAAAFHAAADVVALAELLAGAEKRMGRWSGSIRIRGKRGRARALRAALVRSDLSLAAVARAGARLEPDLVFPALAYAVDPAWTRGHRFTVAQEILDPEPERWHVTARDGASLAVGRTPPPHAPPDAVVSMSRATFDRLLRGEPAPNGERPQVRGDRAAVATLKAWTDTAQAR